LYTFGTRYYDPSLGRWTQQDPVGGSLGDLNSANRYVYAGDDPVNLVDPSGKDAFDCALAIAVIVLTSVIVVAAILVLIFAASPLTDILFWLAWIGALGGADLLVIQIIQTLRSGVCSSH
jgi:hypothetical protein